MKWIGIAALPVGGKNFCRECLENDGFDMELVERRYRLGCELLMEDFSTHVLDCVRMRSMLCTVDKCGRHPNCCVSNCDVMKPRLEHVTWTDH